VRLLLVEDEPLTVRMLAKGLREQAYAVDIAESAQAASMLVADHDYDLIVLDLGLPDGDGLTLCRRIREAGTVAPILILTARDAVDSRIAGLDSGADDYLLKPFDFGELLARLRALVRRGRLPLLPERLTVGPLAIDTRSRRVRVRSREVSLTAKEYALLEYFVRRAGDVVSRADISEHVWDEHHDPLSNIVDVYVQRLRRKLDRSGSDSLIRTRRGEGYQLVSGAAAS